MKRGDFIVFEGINCCGKGTQLPKFTEYVYGLSKSNAVFRTREPNDFDDSGRKMREMMFSNEDPHSYNTTMLKHFTQNRKTHNRIFDSILSQGIHTFSDRYWHSNFAFQSVQGISYEDIAKMNRSFRIPDLTFLIDVPANIAFDRLWGRDGEERRKFDSDEAFLGEVRDSYLELPSVLPGLIGDRSIVVINGNQSIEGVFREIKSAYNSFLKMRNS
ncbi:MAG: dTMP kinase [Nanoarchaeota archaeon]|nr:dTMP kinase [Nanoarchaeota archaeon]